MIRRRLLAPRLLALVTCAAFALALPFAAAKAADADQAKAFVGKVVDDGMTTFAGKKMPRGERAAKLKDILLRYADLSLSGQDMLGRYWGKASPEEQALFKTTLLDYVLATWTDTLSDVDTGAKITVNAVEAKAERLLVHSVAEQPGDEPSVVDWVIAEAGGKLVVADVAVSGVSLVDTMKADFTSVLRSGGGKMEVLIAAMKKKIDAAPK